MTDTKSRFFFLDEYPAFHNFNPNLRAVKCERRPDINTESALFLKKMNRQQTKSA